MRQTYETAEDRNRERATAERFARYFSVNVEHNPQFAAIDCRLSGGMLKDEVVPMEVKCRKINWGDYDSIMLSGMKFAVGMDSVRRGGRFLFLVRTFDAMKVFEALPHHMSRLTSGWGGRKDRNDSADCEWVVYIPIDLFNNPSDLAFL